MIISVFQGIAFGIAALAIGMVFKGYILIPSLLIFVSALFLIPKHIWIAFGEVLADGWSYIAPRAQVLGGKAANHAGNVAQQAGNGFRADPWFWSGVISTTLGIAFLLGAAWNQSLGALFVAGVLFLLSSVCFITYYDGWGPIGEGLAKTGTFLGEQALKLGEWATEKFFKYPLYIVTTIFVVLFISSHYFYWSPGSKWLWGILAFVFTWASVVTARKKWSEFWKITFENPRPVLITTGICFFLIGFFTKAFVPGGLGELLGTFGGCLVLVGTIGIALWNKVIK